MDLGPAGKTALVAGQPGAGQLLAAGARPRAAAVLPALSLVPATAAGHPFRGAGENERGTGQAGSAKNAGLPGALLLPAAPAGPR
jgi:uncharacterized membrane protein YphA (DoxX/SURF4 family)